jgi:hypothetical protein
MQEAAVFSRYTRATARSSLYALEKKQPINKNAMKGGNNSKKKVFIECRFIMKQPFNNAIYHLVQQ